MVQGLGQGIAEWTAGVSRLGIADNPLISSARYISLEDVRYPLCGLFTRIDDDFCSFFRTLLDVLASILRRTFSPQQRLPAMSASTRQPLSWSQSMERCATSSVVGPAIPAVEIGLVFQKQVSRNRFEAK